MACFVGSELVEKLDKPLVFQWSPAGTEGGCKRRVRAGPGSA
jgi:hypothetical protein